MAEALELSGSERVLEIGTGSGYSAAILSRLAREVFSVERLPDLAEAAAQRLQQLGCDNVRVICADGSLGLPHYAPFDAITVAAAAPRVPEPLYRQLSDGGRLVAPVGDRGDQTLIRVVRHGTAFQTTQLSQVRFIALIGEHGWKDTR
jgi:protein-L-isoaspartate(D-aspartate) O-methyltransferase